MATWYKAWIGSIEPVEVVKETPSQVVVSRTSTPMRLRGDDTFEAAGPAETYVRRESKRTEYHAYFKTWDEAKQHLVDSAAADVEIAESRLDDARERLATMEALTR